MPGPPSFSAPRCVIEPLEARIAPAAVVSPNGQTVKWTDIDGDAVRLHVSKSLFTDDNVNSVLTFDTQGAQQQLLVIDFTKLGQAAADVNLKVTATMPTVGTGDGSVNVGFIKAAIPNPEVFAFTKGIDLGVIIIDGDLGGLYAGDKSADAAVQKIDVGSWGALNATEQTAQNAGTIPTDLRSIMLAPVKEVKIAGDFDGTFGARLDVIGANFGRIGKLTIGDDLLGGTAAKSGRIFATGNMGRVEITGDIVGGQGANSANVQGIFKTLRVGGSLLGGSGNSSGSIVSGGDIQSVIIGGNITGGSGGSSGALDLAGFGAGTVQKVVIGKADATTSGNVTGGTGGGSALIRFGAAEQVTIYGSVTGGSGASSAQLNAGSITRLDLRGSLIGGSGVGSAELTAGAITRLDLGGSLIGGSAQSAGSIQISSVERLLIGGDITGGTASLTGFFQASAELGRGVIEGNLTGGSATAGTVSQAGTINSARIQHLEIEGNLTTGTAASGATLVASGAITASVKIDTLIIGGNVTGNAGTAAVISATGPTTGGTSPAIKTLTIAGNVDHANILAGYGVTGTALNSDAQIGTITLGTADKTVSATNIVAGATRGTDGIFGTADDVRVATATGTTDRAEVTSRIASIIIAGTVANGSSGSGFGIVADQVQSVKIGTVEVSLLAGKYNDRPPVAVPGTTDFQVVELAPPVAPSA